MNNKNTPEILAVGLRMYTFEKQICFVFFLQAQGRNWEKKILIKSISFFYAQNILEVTNGQFSKVPHVIQTLVCS